MHPTRDVILHGPQASAALRRRILGCCRFCCGDDAIKDAEHRRDSDQEAQAAPLDSLRSGHLLVHCFSSADYFQVGQIEQRHRHETVVAKVEYVGMTPM